MTRQNTGSNAVMSQYSKVMSQNTKNITVSIYSTVNECGITRSESTANSFINQSISQQMVPTSDNVHFKVLRMVSSRNKVLIKK